MRRSLKESMSTQKEITAADTAALLAYLETLEPAANPHRTSTGDLTEAARRGLAVFEGKGACAECHAGDHLTSDKVYAVGLVGPRDRMREFNPPTLRGLYTRRRFLHDGRAKSLDEVLSKHHRPEDIAGEALTEQELADLLDYLRSL
jgi:cytochrome c peroxidase